MFRLRFARRGKPPLLVTKLIEHEGDVVYFDPEKGERNKRGKTEFNRLFEKVKQ
jgi:hypothetical protein